MASVAESLKTWLRTFHIDVPSASLDDLSDGVAMGHVLSQIAPEFFNAIWLSKIKTDLGNNWRLKASNLKKILKGVLDYYEAIGQQITGFRMPDINVIAEQNDSSELGRLLQLILGCAVNCERKEEYIQTIMGLGEEVQHVVMNALQELMTKETSVTCCVDSYTDVNEQVKRLAEDLHASNKIKEQISQRCHELDSQVAVLQEEKASLLQENQKLQERLNYMESLEDPSTVAGKRFQHLQHKLDILQAEVFKLETARDECKIKVDLQDKEILELQQKNEDLLKLAEEARTLKDELDVLRHLSSKVEQYEALLETYKKKLEDMSDLRKQMKLLEEKNTNYMHQVMELEEEVKKVHTVKSQLEIYKKQTQELHAKLSDVTRRADKAEFEGKRVSEKLTSVQREKEHLIAERDSMKETIEELRCMQLQSESAGLQDGDNKRVSSSLSDSDVLEALPPGIKEKLARLQYENKMLKLKQSGNEDQHLSLLKTMLDDSKARENELETENRLCNQRIIELESQLQDLHENQAAASSQEGAELRHKLNLCTKKQKETEAELQKKQIIVDSLENQLEDSVQKARHQQELLNKKEEEMRQMEERYKKYLEKAKKVIRSLDPKLNLDAEPHVFALRNQLQEKDRLIAELEKDAEKIRAQWEFEEKLMTSAFYHLGARLQRQAAEDRAVQNPAGQSFLARQRQTTSRRLTVQGVTSSEFLN